MSNASSRLSGGMSGPAHLLNAAWSLSRPASRVAALRQLSSYPKFDSLTAQSSVLPQYRYKAISVPQHVCVPSPEVLIT